MGMYPRVLNIGLTTRSSLSKEILAMYRSGKIQPVRIRYFDAANIIQAYRYFSSRERIGKVVITFGNPQSLVPVSLSLTMFRGSMSASLLNSRCTDCSSQISGRIRFGDILSSGRRPWWPRSQSQQLDENSWSTKLCLRGPFRVR